MHSLGYLLSSSAWSVCVCVCVKEWKAESHIKLSRELGILRLKQGAYPQLVVSDVSGFSVVLPG